MTDQPPPYPAPPYSGRAMMALIIGLASPLLVLAAVWFGLAAAAAAVALALASRRELKADPGLRGFGFSLAALLIGGGVLIVAGVRLLMSPSLVALVPN